MPSWSPNWSDVVFDHGAAAALVDVLDVAAARLRGDADARGATAERLVVDWEGRAHDSAAPRLQAIPRDLETLAADLRRAAGDVTDASELARTEQRRREDDRRRWQAEANAERAAADAERAAAEAASR